MLLRTDPVTAKITYSPLPLETQRSMFLADICIPLGHGLVLKHYSGVAALAAVYLPAGRLLCPPSLSAGQCTSTPLVTLS
jgi:hypothetical protein